MIQGNPFEAEFVVRDRTTAVRQGVARQRPSIATEGLRTQDSWWQAVASAISTFGLQARRVSLIRDGSWIAVGIAIGIALSSLIN